MGFAVGYAAKSVYVHFCPPTQPYVPPAPTPKTAACTKNDPDDGDPKDPNCEVICAKQHSSTATYHSAHVTSEQACRDFKNDLIKSLGQKYGTWFKTPGLVDDEYLDPATVLCEAEFDGKLLD